MSRRRIDTLEEARRQGSRFNTFIHALRDAPQLDEAFHRRRIACLTHADLRRRTRHLGVRTTTQQHRRFIRALVQFGLVRCLPFEDPAYVDVLDCRNPDDVQLVEILVPGKTS